MKTTTPARLPDATSLERVLGGLGPALADTDLVATLGSAFAGFGFSVAHIDDEYWLDTRWIIRPDGTRIGELRPWMTAELASEGGDIKALWTRLKDSDLQITEWRGTSVFVFAPTGTAPADYIQIALGRETEWRAGPIVNPDYRPWGAEELLDPSWPGRDNLPDTDPGRFTAFSIARAAPLSIFVVSLTAVAASNAKSARLSALRWSSA